MSKDSDTLSWEKILNYNVQDLSGGKKMLLQQGVARSFSYSLCSPISQTTDTSQLASWMLQIAVGNAHG